MKKHLHNSLRALFLSLAVLLSLPMLAEQVEIGGINYDLNAETNQATVIEKSSGGYSGEIVIPESVEYGGTDYSVTSIGEWAFCGCSGLTSVTIPNSVTSIGDHAFDYCSGLTSVTIPNSVESIGEFAFRFCSGLTSVTIPNNVTSIGEEAFCGCSGLTSIVVEEGNTVYDSRNNCNAIIETASNTLHFGCKTTIIPNSVTSIGDKAFLGCSGLTSVTIPNSVKSIGYCAFDGCSGLTSVTIPNSVTSIGVAAFEECSGLTSVTIPNSVERIGDYAFDKCPKLHDVYCYAEEAPTTENNAFDGSSIQNAILHVPTGSVDSYTATAPWKDFGNIVAITTEVDGINYDFNADTKEATVIEKSSGGYSGEVVIPESVEYGGTAYSVTSIGDEAFWGCDGLTSVTIPNSVTSIGSSAFRDCSGLTSVTIGNSVESIGESAFFRCSGVTSVTIPNSVASIEEWAFCGCSGLTSIVVEEGNTVYDSRNNCNAIIETASNTLHLGCKTTVIPNSVTSIGSSAFYECSDLTSVTIPNSVTSIGRYAFEHCDGLTSVTIPNSVTSIGNAAFYDCPELLDVYCYAENVPSTESNAFEYSPIKDATLHVPAGSVDSYNETAPWDGFANIVALPNQYELTVSSAGYATLCLAYNAEIPQDVEVYVAEKVDGDCLKMNKVEGVLPAMTGVIVKANEGTYAFIQSKDTPAEIGENLLVGSVANTMVRADDDTSYYILAAPDENNNEVGMYPVELVDGAFLCKANKAYLPISSAHARIYFDFGTETGILETENGNVKTENCYDLSGRRVQNAQKGIFIVNGKKVVK